MTRFASSSQNETQHPIEDARTHNTNGTFSNLLGWSRTRLATAHGDEQTPLLGSNPPAPSSVWWGTTWDSGRELWVQGKGMILVMLAQFFGASMNVMTQVLEIKGRNGKGFHPFQV
jgi:hypothetical protein